MSEKRRQYRFELAEDLAQEFDRRLNCNPKTSESFVGSLREWLQKPLTYKESPSPTVTQETEPKPFNPNLSFAKPRPMPNDNPTIKAYRENFARKQARIEESYLRQKAVQQAKTEGTLERKKLLEEQRQTFIADRAEIEYSQWKRKQDERERTQRPRPVHVDFPNSAMFSDNEGWT